MDKLTKRQPTQTIPQDIILRGDDMCGPKGEHRPDKNIRDDSRRHAIAIHRDGAIPEEAQQGPGIGTRDGGEMHEGREMTVAPGGGVLVEEARDEQDLGGPEVVARPEQDPDEEEEVVEHEVRGYVGGGGD